MKFIVIGITDQPHPWFQPDVLELIKDGKVFSGGKRHHEIVAPLLPDGAKWIDITVPLDHVFAQYTADEIIVFASGDPLFFGFANTIKRKMPDADIVVHATFNSLQMLAHRLVMPYHDMRIVSLTGRPWPEFDKALIERAEKIGVLTDKEHTPATIAQRMLDFVQGKASKLIPPSSYAAGLQPSRLDQWLPQFISHRLTKGFKIFDRQARGFLTNEAIVIGVETRTSSPLRITRDSELLHHIDVKGLYPCGEGAGYAGGIVSSAIDGERCAEALFNAKFIIKE